MKYRYICAGLMLLTSIIFFILGMYFPILTTKYSIWGMSFSEKAVNIFDSVILFFETKDYALAIVILLFTFIFPIVKYIELWIRLICDKLINSLRTNIWLQNIDKWNMLDVFVVALLLLNFKLQDGVLTMDMSLGSLFIALAVITRMATIILLTNNTDNHEENTIDTTDNK